MRTCFTMLICLCLVGCAGSSQKKLAKILEETDSLTVLSAPDDCGPHFYPAKGSCCNLGNFGEGLHLWGSSAISDLEGFYSEDPFSGMFVLSYIGGSAVVGGFSNVCRKPLLTNNYSSILCSAFEGRNPGDQVAQIIDAKYNGNSPDSGGRGMLLKIHKMDYGLCGATKDNITTHFFMTVGIELIRSNDDRRYYHRNFEYTSASRSLKEWVDDDRKILQNEYDRACQYLGDLISSEFVEAKYLSLNRS